jgi:aconitate hydratase
VNLAHKLLKAHLVDGDLIPGQEIGITIDHTLLQDATGTLAMLEFEAMGLNTVKAELSAQYVDHNILQTDNKNADDHIFLQTACQKYGIHFSRPGNGVSHQVHLARFGVPGKTLLGADSHTPGGVGVSMLAIGAGGLDVAMAMAGFPYYLPCPKIFGVKLVGELSPWVSAKDVILEMLKRYDVRGCLGKIVEYYGPGVKTLSVADRMVLGNMGAELGATSTVIPSDERTREFLSAQGRGESWVELLQEEGAEYDEYDEIDLSRVEPLIALPSSPGNVVPIREVAGTKVDQVLIGSSANSGYRQLMVAAKIFEDKVIHPRVSLHINPGSRQILENVIGCGGITLLLKAGARVNEAGCLGCIGMGQAPGTGQISLRTFPRNFPGRSGTKDDRVYLCSPETAAASALNGEITDPRDLGEKMVYPQIKDPERFLVDDSSILFPLEKEERENIEVVKGPNIKPFPELDELPNMLEAEVLLKVGDNVSTDTIMPAGNKVLPLRSNIEAISEYVYYQIDPKFAQKARKKKNVVIIGGENYGQGSSREHAALAPRFLGVRIKIAKSFSRIHMANLCNFGVLHLQFKNPADYDRIHVGSKVILRDIRDRMERKEVEIPVEIDGETILTIFRLTPRLRQYILAGSALNFVRQMLKI